jgi:3-hydroxybutyrate dehydrogenase
MPGGVAPPNGKRALVTGGGRGIGEAIARGLAAAGARVTVCGRGEADLKKVAAEIAGDYVVADLADRASTERLLAELGAIPSPGSTGTRTERRGSIDILVNNAGAAESAPLERTSDEMWDRILELDATAPFRVTRALVPGMVAAGWGRIINVASNAGVSGYAYTTAYCAAKHALVGMTRALAVDLARTGVTINALCPGWVETQMAEEAIARISAKTGRPPADARAQLAAMSPQRRMITTAEVAHAAVMLCADAARGIHGQNLVIDGGAILN